MQYHLVKRNPDLNATKGKRRGGGDQWIVQTQINKRPSGSKVRVGDFVYFYEVGYAVWAKGIVKRVNIFQKINTIENFLQLVTEKSQDSFQYINNFYWGTVLLEKVWPKLSQKNNHISVLEVEIDLEVLQSPIFLSAGFNNQTSWQYLSHELISEDTCLELSTKIPSSLKLQLYEKYNLKGDAHYFDIDHFVPASVGGPGNIEENLVPLAFGINRYKSDRVPAGLFHVAKEMGYFKGKLPTEKGFLRNGQSNWRDEAKIVTMNVNKEEVDKVKDFYRKVRSYHIKNLYQQK